MRAILAHVMAALVVTSVAAAEPRSHKDRGDGGSSASAGSADSEEGEADDQDEGDTQPALVTNRTPEQTAMRQAIVDKRTKAIGDIVHAGGKPVTASERQAIGLHWRHVMRLLRIRELAEADGDKAILTRVDAVLARESTKFDAKLTRLHDEPAKAADATEHAKGGSK
jgi:hypothetical protein